MDTLGSGLIVLGSLQFGGVVVLGKLVTDAGLPVPAYLAVRFAVAAVLLAAALAVTGQPLAAARGERWRLVVLGMAGYGLEAGLFFAALRHGSAATATLLFFIYPVLVTLLVAVAGRGLPGGLVVVALCSSVAGAALVVVAGHGLVISGVGVLFALAAALVFSLYLLGADVVLDRTNSLTGSMWVSAAAAVALAAAAAVSGTDAWPVGLAQWGPGARVGRVHRRCVRVPARGAAAHRPGARRHRERDRAAGRQRPRRDLPAGVARRRDRGWRDADPGRGGHRLPGAPRPSSRPILTLARP